MQGFSFELPKKVLKAYYQGIKAIFFEQPMTAIIRSGSPNANQIVIPASITTLEQLNVWTLRALWQMHKNSDFYPDKDLPPVRRIQRSPFINGAGKLSYLYSVYHTFDDELGIDGTSKEWSAVDEITDVVPSNFFNA